MVLKIVTLLTKKTGWQKLKGKMVLKIGNMMGGRTNEERLAVISVQESRGGRGETRKYGSHDQD